MLLKASEAFNGSHSVSSALCVSRSASLHVEVVAADLLFAELMLTLIMAANTELTCAVYAVGGVFGVGGGLLF